MNEKFFRDRDAQRPNETRIMEFFARHVEQQLGVKVLSKQNVRGRVQYHDFTLTALYPDPIEICYEVKCDLDAEKYGNAFFETGNPITGAHTGLSSCTAHLWAHYVPHRSTIFRFDPKRMLSWVQTKPQYHKPRCGDGGNSCGYAVPIDVVGRLPCVEKFEFPLTDPSSCPQK